ncbi:EexN family lipoprotein [Rosenbergiella nectarea]|uniref:EexN family lipoprotein n=1 Tax=Rosenbergiella nectarea TaxID=988801 RepID=UPI001F4E17F2|nr:EexN family lipoprotein [Rosenbergiella nectarea]
MKKYIFLIAAIFTLTACDKTYTVSDFQSDRALMKQFLQKCRNGELDGESLNCRNADKAASLG